MLNPDILKRRFLSSPLVQFCTALLLSLLLSAASASAQENSPPIAVVVPATAVGVRSEASLVSTNDDLIIVPGGNLVTFDGSGSSDPDGDALTYSWEQLVGVDVVLIGGTTPILTFIAPASGVQRQTLIFRLTVSDQGGLSDTRVRDVFIAATNQRPIAVAGMDQDGLHGGSVTLDGSGSSDPDGDNLSYRWEQTDNSGFNILANMIFASTEMSPTIIIRPEIPIGTVLTLRLTVYDGSLFSTTTSASGVTITVIAPAGGGDSPTTSTPIADRTLQLAGGTRTVDVSDNFADPDSTTLTYGATSATAATATVSIDAATGLLTLTPVAEGTSLITVTAQDGSNTAATQSFTVTVTDPPLHVNIVAPKRVRPGKTVTLDGSGSTGRGMLTYAWTQIEIDGNAVVLTDAATAMLMFTAPTEDTMLTFKLMVTEEPRGVGDTTGLTATDTVRIIVKAGASIPETVETINRFMHTRTNLILANQPKLSRRINRLQRGVGSEQLSFSTGEITKLKPFEFNFLSLGSGNYKFATSLDQVTRAADHLQVMQGDVGGLTATHERRRFDVWFEVSFNKFNGSADTSGDFAIAYLGADYLVSPDLLLGALVQYDKLSAGAASEDSMTEGKGWMVGPYVTARLQENLYLDARLAWGTSDNDISPPDSDYTDSFKSTRRLANIAYRL